MRITELSIEGCLKLENERNDTGYSTVTQTYSSENYKDLIVSTTEDCGVTVITPS